MTNQKKVICQLENEAAVEEVAMVNMTPEEAINLLIQGMCNQQEKIEELEAQVSDLNTQFVKIAQILAGLEQRSETFNQYIHSYVDIEGMAKLVVAIAEETDIDINKYYTQHTIQ